MQSAMQHELQNSLAQRLLTWTDNKDAESVLILKGHTKVQCVPLATKPGISLIILTPMKILQRNLNRSTFVVWEMKRNVSVECVCSAPICCDKEQRSASQPGSVASGTHCTNYNISDYVLLRYISLRFISSLITFWKCWVIFWFTFVRQRAADSLLTF